MTIFHVEKKIDKPTKVQALDGMRKKQLTFPVNILDVIRGAQLVLSFIENEFFEPQNTSLVGILQNAI